MKWWQRLASAFTLWLIWIGFASFHHAFLHPPDVTALFLQLPGSNIAAEKTFLRWGEALLPILWTVYIPLYFTALPLALLYAIFRRDELFEEIIAAVLVAYALSFTIYSIFVVQPPHEALHENPLGVRVSKLGNPRFVFPSLHIGIATILAAIFWEKRDRLRWYFVILAVLMPLAVVLLLQHWIWDVVGGWALAWAAIQWRKRVVPAVKTFEERINRITAVLISLLSAVAFLWKI